MEISPVSAREQMQWQEYMSNTAHQREVADLKAAGLNPVLSAHSTGASTPSGSHDSLSEILGLANSALGVARSGMSGVKDVVEDLTDLVQSISPSSGKQEMFNESSYSRPINFPENGTLISIPFGRGGRINIPNTFANQLQDYIVAAANDRYNARTAFQNASYYGDTRSWVGKKSVLQTLKTLFTPDYSLDRRRAAAFSGFIPSGSQH